jgi:hypothetical protein
MLEIEKDLVRWPRGKWIGVVIFVFAAQVGAIIWGSQKKAAVREFYPKETIVALPEQVQKSDWDELDDPFLFATANWHGFSADAWLKKPEWRAPETGRPVPARFLDYSQGRGASGSLPESEPFAFLERRKPAAVFLTPREAPTSARKSELRVEGLEERRLINELTLATQFHTDVLSNTVVEALVGRDGLVISARVVENSGSVKADADALALTRTARFSPKGGTNPAPALGKLIFEWFALDLSATNNRSKNVR